MHKRRIWEIITFDPGTCDPHAPAVYHCGVTLPGGERHGFVGNVPGGHQRHWDYHVDNAFKILNGVPFHPEVPDGFLAIHHALARAARERGTATFRLLENCPLHDLEARRRHWSAELDCPSIT